MTEKKLLIAGDSFSLEQLSNNCGTIAHYTKQANLAIYKQLQIKLQEQLQ